MRIGFTGAGGTGKTTVMGLIGADTGLEILPSVVRGVFQQFQIKSEDDQIGREPDFLWKLQRTILERKLERDQRVIDFIADRTPLDHWVYCLFRCNAYLSDGVEFQQWEREIRSALLTYDAVFYFPTGLFTPKDDGTRVQSPAYHAMIDAMIRGYLDRWRIEHIPLNFEGPEIRADIVKSVIARLRAGK